MLLIYTGPTTSVHQRTLLASYETWKTVLPRLEQPIARIVEQSITRNRNLPLIRVEFSVENASKVLAAAQHD